MKDLWPVPAIKEMIRIFPDAVFWGVGILAMSTLSYSYGMLFASLVEGIFIFLLARGINNSIGIIDTDPNPDSSERTCRSSLAGVSLESVSVFGEPGQISFPSSHIYMISFIASYVLSTIVMFKEELEILGNTYGEGYDSRIFFSVVSFSTIIFVAMAYRLFYKCDGFMVIALSLIIGVISGVLVVQQNSLLFGLESINLLGIPILRSRTATGSDLYVCSSIS
jgi:hypothetical protein